MALLLVEDNLEISEMIKDFLEVEDFEVVVAHDGEEALAQFQKQEFELVLLDLMLPKINGIEVLRKIREVSKVPVLILSAKVQDADKVLGLGLGADDYITKPFSLIELKAKIKANIRRHTEYAQEKPRNKTLQAGALSLDFERYMAVKNGVEIELTAKEFEIMKLLMENPQRVYTKEQIYSLVWKDTYMGDENALNVHISRLRTKLEDDAKKPKYITTVWGIGYKWGE